MDQSQRDLTRRQSSGGRLLTSNSEDLAMAMKTRQLRQQSQQSQRLNQARHWLIKPADRLRGYSTWNIGFVNGCLPVCFFTIRFLQNTSTDLYETRHASIVGVTLANTKPPRLRLWFDVKIFPGWGLYAKSSVLQRRRRSLALQYRWQLARCLHSVARFFYEQRGFYIGLL